MSTQTLSIVAFPMGNESLFASVSCLMSYNDFVFSLFSIWLFCLSPHSLPGCDIAWWPLNSPYGAGTAEPIEQITPSRCFSDDCVAPCDFNVNLPDRHTNFIWGAQDEDVLLKKDPNCGRAYLEQHVLSHLHPFNLTSWMLGFLLVVWTLFNDAEMW